MDAVVPEPEEGAHTDPDATAANLKRAIVESLDELLRARRPRSCSSGATTASARSAPRAASRYSRIEESE